MNKAVSHLTVERRSCEVWQQDLLAMTLPPVSFEGVFANAVLFHVPSRPTQRAQHDAGGW
jgi:hypothetical protein